MHELKKSNGGIVMSKIDLFEKELDELLEKYSDLPYHEIADSLDYYCADYIRKADREGIDYDR